MTERWKEIAMTKRTFDLETQGLPYMTYETLVEQKMGDLYEVGEWMETEDACKCIAELEEERDRLAEAEALLRKSRQTHRYCDDDYYSCPKHPDGCFNYKAGDECDCGADEWNAKLDAFLAAGEKEDTYG